VKLIDEMMAIFGKEVSCDPQVYTEADLSYLLQAILSLSCQSRNTLDGTVCPGIV